MLKRPCLLENLAMTRLSLAKALPLPPVQEVPDLLVDITTPLAEFATLEEAEQFYRQQAEALTTALARTLPQGTMHWLLIALLLKYPAYYLGSLPEFQFSEKAHD